MKTKLIIFLNFKSAHTLLKRCYNEPYSDKQEKHIKWQTQKKTCAKSKHLKKCSRWLEKKHNFSSKILSLYNFLCVLSYTIFNLSCITRKSIVEISELSELFFNISVTFLYWFSLVVKNNYFLLSKKCLVFL